MTRAEREPGANMPRFDRKVSISVNDWLVLDLPCEVMNLDDDGDTPGNFFLSRVKPYGCREAI